MGKTKQFSWGWFILGFVIAFFIPVGGLLFALPLLIVGFLWKGGFGSFLAGVGLAMLIAGFVDFGSLLGGLAQ